MIELDPTAQMEIYDCFTRKQLRALAKNYGINRGRNKWDTIRSLIYSGKLIDIEFKIGI